MWSFMLEPFHFYQIILWHSVNVNQCYVFLSGEQLRLYIYQNQIILIHHMLAA